MPASIGPLRNRFAVASMLAAAALASTAPAQATAVRQPYMPVGEMVEPPYGYFDYCHRKQVACGEFGGAAAAQRDAKAVGSSYWDLVFQPQEAPQLETAGWELAEMSPEQWRQVVAINRQVNADVAADSDEREYRQRDFWALPRFRKGRKRGDCEDYVLQKRAALIAAGVPERALSIAIAKTRKREVHAVLLISTQDGDYVLDNRSAWISRWDELNYRWERRQVPGSQTWVRVAESRPAV